MIVKTVTPHKVIGIKWVNICKASKKYVAHGECRVCVHCSAFQFFYIEYKSQEESTGIPSSMWIFVFICLMLFIGKNPEAWEGKVSAKKMCPRYALGALYSSLWVTSLVLLPRPLVVNDSGDGWSFSLFLALYYLAVGFTTVFISAFLSSHESVSVCHIF